MILFHTIKTQSSTRNFFFFLSLCSSVFSTTEPTIIFLRKGKFFKIKTARNHFSFFHSFFFFNCSLRYLLNQNSKNPRDFILFNLFSVPPNIALNEKKEKHRIARSTNSRSEIFNGVGDEADKKTTFADGGVADQQDLE